MSHLNGLDSVGEVGKELGLWPLEAGSCSLDLGLAILKSSLRSDTAAPWLVRSTGGLALKQLLPRKFSDELFFIFVAF